MEYSTKTTKIKDNYCCRVYYNNVFIVEGRCKDRSEIGAVYRDLLRTMDKLHSTAYSSSARDRKFKEGNKMIYVKHLWNRS